ATSSRVTITMQDAVTGKDLGKEVRQPGFVGAMVFASDGQFLAACGEEASVYLWSPPTGKPFGPPLRHREIVRSLLLSPDDRRLLTAGV
ncbi:WD40 repeat domain-containing protein, partial [Enterococcus faecium]|uniref:WD40 repeat domain-containing protein n=1 Tax=Enterococcus faecium TaxID=1352 RepID=UPI003F4235CD